MVYIVDLDIKTWELRL